MNKSNAISMVELFRFKNVKKMFLVTTCSTLALRISMVFWGGKLAPALQQESMQSLNRTFTIFNQEFLSGLYIAFLGLLQMNDSFWNNRVKILSVSIAISALVLSILIILVNRKDDNDDNYSREEVIVGFINQVLNLSHYNMLAYILPAEIGNM